MELSHGNQNTLLQVLIDEIVLLRQDRGDFVKFKDMLTPGMLDICDSRWYISICDTYADYGTQLEQCNACTIVGIFNMVRVAGTFKFLFRQNKSHVPLYDGFMTLALDHKADTFRNYSRRLSRCLCQTPVLLDIFSRLVLRAKLNKNLIQGFNDVAKKEIFPICN